MQSGLVHVLLLFLGFTKLLLHILTTLEFTLLITNNHKLPPQLLLNILSNTANPWKIASLLHLKKLNLIYYTQMLWYFPYTKCCSFLIFLFLSPMFKLPMFTFSFFAFSSVDRNKSTSTLCIVTLKALLSSLLYSRLPLWIHTVTQTHF